jgi:hypothetical protein
MSKEALVFAAIERLAKKTGDSDLVDYLAHSSHHSGAFQDEINAHHANLNDLDAFNEAHEALTHPGASAPTYTKAEVDAMIQAAINRARFSQKPAAKAGE